MHSLPVRPPAVAGLFYPAEPAQLRDEVACLLAGARVESGYEPGPAIKALIVPHAGYVYSGPTAAAAYAALGAQAGRIRRVVLLGPAHRVALRGLALPSAGAFATPLGRVEIDADAAALLTDLPQVIESAEAHTLEHALEVQLPFLQAVLGEFRLLPLVVGTARASEVAEVLERLWGGDETLILISSDLSHYHRYAEAKRLDAETCQRILAADPDQDRELDHEHACGATPIRGLLLAARRHALQPRLLDRRNSGDTAGDRQRVVGYAAFAFAQAGTPKARARDEALGRTALAHARASIAAGLGYAAAALPEHTALDHHTACFVTLHRAGRLRGCIGTLQADAPLRDNLRRYARAAAFEDPRFPPLAAHELHEIEIEVSLLSPLDPLSARDESEAVAQLQPGHDGVVLDCDGRRSTFLPQVWAQLPDPRDFLAALRNKAGLPHDRWQEGTRLWRYQVEHWQEAP